MGIFNSINTSGSGLKANRIKMDVISENIANMNTTKTAAGGPYKRKDVSFAAYLKREQTANGEIRKTSGVKVSKVAEDQRPPRQVYNPSHPDADENGYVLMPNIDVATEMVNMMSAQRGYEANVTAINAGKNMMVKALEIGNK